MAAADPTRASRLNPLAFPAETDVRFVMLMVAAIALTVVLSNALRYALSGAENSFSQRITSPDSELDDETYFRQVREESIRSAVDAGVVVLTSAGMVLVLVAVAWRSYRRHPARLRRRCQLAVLAADQDPKFQQAVHSLARGAGVTPPPRIEVSQSLRSSGGQAFGWRGNYALRLDGGLRVVLRKAPDQFRAIVLHELGHIANRDVGRTYFAQSIWSTFTLLILAPLVLALLALLIRRLPLGVDLNKLLTVNLPPLLLILLQACGILALVAMIRASLLRVREFYADWRAATWGAREPLSGVMRVNLQKSPLGKRNPWRLHPTAQERLLNLEQPGRLFRTSLELALLSGMLFGITLEGTTHFSMHVGFALSNLSSAMGAGAAQSDLLESAWVLFLASFVVAILAIVTGFFFLGWLISGTVGLQVQRETVAELGTGVASSGYWGLGRLAAVLAVGMEIGFLMTPFGIFGAQYMDSFIEIIPWLLAWTAMFWLCLLFARFHGTRVLGSHAGKTPPTARRRALTLAVTLLISVGMLPMLGGRFMWLHTLTAEDRAPFLTVIAFGVPGWLVLYGVMWAFCWLVWQALLTFAPPRCPNCHHATGHARAVATTCDACHQELAAWLFVPKA